MPLLHLQSIVQPLRNSSQAAVAYFMPILNIQNSSSLTSPAAEHHSDISLCATFEALLLKSREATAAVRH